MAHIGMAVYDWTGLVGYTERPVSKSTRASWLKKDGYYPNGGDGLKVDGDREAEALFAVYGREQPKDSARPVSKNATAHNDWTCHYCGMPATDIDFFGAPVCDQCSH